MAKGKYDYDRSAMCTKDRLEAFVENKRREPGVTDVRAMQINATSYFVTWKTEGDNDDAEKGR